MRLTSVAPWWIVLLAVGSLVLGPVFGMVIGGLAEAVGVDAAVALHLTLGTALTVVWGGQVASFVLLWRRGAGYADRVLVTTGTLVVMCPMVMLLLVASALR